jgi:hypothetical protein
MARKPEDTRRYEEGQVKFSEALPTYTQSGLPEEDEGVLNIVSTPTGSQLETGELASPNFISGQKGWRVDSDGKAEFSDIKIFGIPDVQTFTANGTWSKPSSGSIAFIQMWGGGGSGAGTDGSGSATGGGGGAYTEEWVLLTDLGDTETVTIGAGGVGVDPTTKAHGNDGNNTTLGSILTAYGGGGGRYGNSASATGGGGGGLLSAGSGGTAGSVDGGAAGNTSGGAGGDTLYGGAGGGGADGSSTTGTGGNSYYGGAGGGSNCSGASASSGGTSKIGGAGGDGDGTDGTQPAGGGGGLQSGSGTSGAGGDGKCIVTVF